MQTTLRLTSTECLFSLARANIFRVFSGFCVWKCERLSIRFGLRQLNLSANIRVFLNVFLALHVFVGKMDDARFLKNHFSMYFLSSINQFRTISTVKRSFEHHISMKMHQSNAFVGPPRVRCKQFDIISPKKNRKKYVNNFCSHRVFSRAIKKSRSWHFFFAIKRSIARYGPTQPRHPRKFHDISDLIVRKAPIAVHSCARR